MLYPAGESVDISDGDTESVALNDSSGQTLREKMVYMSVGDSHHNQGNHGEFCASYQWGMTVLRENAVVWFCTCWAHLQVGPR